MPLILADDYVEHKADAHTISLYIKANFKIYPSRI